MKIDSVLQSLDNSWSRKEVLIKLRNGTNPENIISEFLSDNKEDIDKLSSFLKSEDKESLRNMQELSICEAILLKKINNTNNSEVDFQQQLALTSNINALKESPKLQFGSFMMKWSNKFVVFTLLTISAIALTKQAWT